MISFMRAFMRSLCFWGGFCFVGVFYLFAVICDNADSIGHAIDHFFAMGF